MFLLLFAYYSPCSLLVTAHLVHHITFLNYFMFSPLLVYSICYRPLLPCILRVSSTTDALAAELKDAIVKRHKKTEAVEKRGNASGS